MNPLSTFAGLRVIESVWLTEAGEPYQIRRSWKERWFSRPWRPLQRTRTVVPQVPMKGGYRLNNDTIVMHPEIIRELRAALAAADATNEETHKCRRFRQCSHVMSHARAIR
jgi:hypothetical protein